MKTLALLILIVCTQGAVAQSNETHRMYDSCKAAVNAMDKHEPLSEEGLMGMLCLGYVQGYVDAMEFRLTGAYSQRALIRSIVNYLDAHPAEIDSPNRSLIVVKAWTSDGMIDGMRWDD